MLALRLPRAAIHITDAPWENSAHFASSKCEKQQILSRTCSAVGYLQGVQAESNAVFAKLGAKDLKVHFLG